MRLYVPNPDLDPWLRRQGIDHAAIFRWARILTGHSRGPFGRWFWRKA